MSSLGQAGTLKEIHRIGFLKHKINNFYNITYNIVTRNRVCKIVFLFQKTKKKTTFDAIDKRNQTVEWTYKSISFTAERLLYTVNKWWPCCSTVLILLQSNRTFTGPPAPIAISRRAAGGTAI